MPTVSNTATVADEHHVNTEETLSIWLPELLVRPEKLSLNECQCGGIAIHFCEKMIQGKNASGSDNPAGHLHGMSTLWEPL